MTEELKTYKMTITIKTSDRMGNLRSWVIEAIMDGLDYNTGGEDILDFDIEEVEEVE